MSNIREECEMKPEWKKWIDLIYENYPDMLTFDIDALVDKNGKEYILEVNGSSQGFAPEHGKQDLEHLRDLVIRKMEIILGQELLNEDNEAKKLFNENENKLNIIDKNYEKDTEIINLKNLVDDLKKKLDYSNEKNRQLLKKYENGTKRIILYALSLIILLIGIFFFIKYKSN
jgi:hypothetical protein